MYENDITPEEYQELIRRQSVIQGIPGKIEDPTEMAKYLEMLAEDKAFIVDDKTGEIKDGSVPQEKKLSNWATNSKNMKWANLKKEDKKIIKLCNLDIEMADKMYEINWAVARENPSLYDWALREKNSVLNRGNQRVQTEATLSRAEGGFERKLVGTQTGQYASENPNNQKKGWLGNLFSGLVGRG